MGGKKGVCLEGNFIRLPRCDVGIAPYDKCRKVMLRIGTIIEHSVGVDDHIDPRSDESLDRISRDVHCTSYKISRK